MVINASNDKIQAHNFANRQSCVAFRCQQGERRYVKIEKIGFLWAVPQIISKSRVIFFVKSYTPACGSGQQLPRFQRVIWCFDLFPLLSDLFHFRFQLAFHNDRKPRDCGGLLSAKFT